MNKTVLADLLFTVLREHFQEFVPNHRAEMITKDRTHLSIRVWDDEDRPHQFTVTVTEKL